MDNVPPVDLQVSQQNLPSPNHFLFYRLHYFSPTETQMAFFFKYFNHQHIKYCICGTKNN